MLLESRSFMHVNFQPHIYIEVYLALRYLGSLAAICTSILNYEYIYQSILATEMLW